MRTQLVTFSLTLIVLAGCGGGREIEEAEAPSPIPVTYLEQGWDDKLRGLFYHTPQGSRLLPYDWFLALDRPDGDGLLRDDEFLDSLRFIPNPDTAGGLNPDLLPIGLAREPAEGDMEAHLGLTCAACHTAQIEYNDSVIRIDGGAAMVDITGFYAAIDESMRKTVEDDDRFTTFAGRVLGDSVDDAAKTKLRAAVKSRREAMPRVPPHVGYARQDAFGAILNNVTGMMLEQPDNFRTADAPASFPFLWDAPQLDWVQWIGVAANPIRRNIGEVFGVFGYLNLTASGENAADLFDTSARLRNLYALEQWINDLKPPKWSEEILGVIDKEKASAGEAIYKQRCVGCHPLPPYPMTPENALGKQFIQIKMIPVDYIGTDPKLIENVLTWNAKTGNLAKVLGKAEAPAFDILVASIVGAFTRLAKQEQLTQQEILAYTGFRPPGQKPPNLKAYKARPLDGVWATAPYLHNGSVPNLYEVLLPPEERSKTFHTGSRKFDSEKVGFEIGPSEGSYEVDTSIPGSMNIGHDFGATLEDADRWELVEFLKTL